MRQMMPGFPSVYVDDIAAAQIRQGRNFTASPFRAQPAAKFVKAVTGQRRARSCRRGRVAECISSGGGVVKDRPPLKELHSLIPSKIAILEKVSTELLLGTLAPGSEFCLKTRSDGTILDGHHRIHVLRRRNFDVDALPREVIFKGDSAGTEKS